MTYENQRVTQTPVCRLPSIESKKRLEKLSSLAMANFVEPKFTRLHKIKSPLKNADAVKFLRPVDSDARYANLADRSSIGGSTGGGGSGGLVVSDKLSGIVRLFSSEGRFRRDLIGDLDPHGVTQCGLECVAVVHSNNWGSSVKIVAVGTGEVLATWGRELDRWTPRAVVATDDEQVVVSNVHSQATTRLGIFTLDGQQVTTFGRASGPGDLVFQSPLNVAYDVISRRVLASDADGNCVKMFDIRGNYVGEFGADRTRDEKGTLCRPLGLCCDRVGNAIVCDSGNGRVALFSRDGRYVCNVLDLAGPPASRRRSRSGPLLLPVAVDLTTSGDRLAVTVDQMKHKTSVFRKLIVSRVDPAL